MPFKAISTALSDVLILEPNIWTDERGFFFESYNERDFFSATNLSVHFVQDNHSGSKPGALRGLHYQILHPQGKLIRVVQGEVFDVCVNLMRSHPQFGMWTGVFLSAKNKRQLWVPPGFAHGFLALSNETEVLYKTTDYYSPANERCLLWNDPAIGIDWPLSLLNGSNPILTNKDLNGSLLSHAEVFD